MRNSNDLAKCNAAGRLKVLVALAALLVAATAPSAAGASADDGYDKPMHALTGAAIAYYTRDSHPMVRWSLIVLAAAGKEVLDRHSDRRDAVATFAGASLSWRWTW